MNSDLYIYFKSTLLISIFYPDVNGGTENVCKSRVFPSGFLAGEISKILYPARQAKFFENNRFDRRATRSEL